MEFFKVIVLHLIELNESACTKKVFLMEAFRSGYSILSSLVGIYYLMDRETHYHCSEINVIYKLLCDVKLKSVNKEKLKERFLVEMFNGYLDNQADSEYKPGCLQEVIEDVSNEFKKEYGRYQKSGVSEQELHERCLNTFKWMINNICHSRFISIKKCPALKEWLNPSPSPT